MEKKIDRSTSFKVFYEEQINSEEVRAKRRKNAARSRAVAERLVQLQHQGLSIDEIMAVLRREFPVEETRSQLSEKPQGYYLLRRNHRS